MITIGINPHKSSLTAVALRPGNAGANTTADNLDILAQAFGQVPATPRRHLLIRGHSAAATYKVIEWLPGAPAAIVADRT